MKYLVMIYCDDSLLVALREGGFDRRMRGCRSKTGSLRARGQLLDSQQLEARAMARTVCVREGRASVVDGPFAETAAYLGSFNLIEAADMDEAALVASSFPWARTGAIEIRRIRDIKLARQQAGG